MMSKMHIPKANVWETIKYDKQLMLTIIALWFGHLDNAIYNNNDNNNYFY